jgi:hypothetical protein
MCVCALILHGDARAADSSVPLEWNVGPMTNGAYRESFDGDLPGWVTAGGASALTDAFPTMEGSDLPVRSNIWFGANVKVLQLETDGDVVSNTLAYADPGGSVSFTNKPVYMDMRVRFDSLENPPGAGLLDAAKMAVFLASDAKLVAVHAGGVATNAAALDTNKWYQVTVKLQGGQFDVLLNDATVFTGLDLKEAGEAGTFSSANFYGTGFVDELYVSHGNPAYVVPGPATSIPALPSPGSNPPTDEEQTRINAWLSANNIVTLDGSLTQDQLSTAYLLAHKGETAVAAVPSYDFGIAKINLRSPSSVAVTVQLEVDDAAKEGAINGRIRLLGKTSIDSEAWDVLADAITPQYADFANGKASYVFTIPAGYMFFKPQIVP